MPCAKLLEGLGEIFPGPPIALPALAGCDDHNSASCALALREPVEFALGRGPRLAIGARGYQGGLLVLMAANSTERNRLRA